MADNIYRDITHNHDQGHHPGKGQGQCYRTDPAEPVVVAKRRTDRYHPRQDPVYRVHARNCQKLRPQAAFSSFMTTLPA